MSNRDATFYDVVGIGNAMVDVMAKVGDGFLTERGLTKSEMTLVGAKEAGKIYADIMPEREISGGSAANTVAGLASIYSAVDECCGIPVHSVFDANDLDGYYCVPAHECPLCKEGQMVDGVVTSYGFSSNS